MGRYIIGSSSFEAEKPRPGLHIVATPIGNLGDITLRALSVLAACDAILCEDTRISSRLTARYGIATRLSPYHDHNAAKLRPAILDRLAGGACLALISDAGMPLISDPGYKLVVEAIARGIAVDVLPGASATLTALALSGLPCDRFMFCGFLSARAGERLRQLEEASKARATLIFFESPGRIVDTLCDIARLMAARKLAVTRELTKLHAEVLRGTPAEVAALLAAKPAIKGEITLVVGPPAGAAAASDADIAGSLRDAATRLSASQAAAQVARTHGISKKQAYARLLRLKSGEIPDAD